MIAKHHRQELQVRRYIDFEGDEDLPLPSESTSHWCGTKEKLDCMRLRVERGEAVFHPMDCSRYVPRRLDDWDYRIPWE